VVLASDYNDRKFGAAKKSYVFQEAVAVLSGAPLWTLVSPSEFAAYISFLRNEIQTFVDKNPIKAVKRAVSLSLILGLNDFADRAFEILTSEDCADHIRTKRKIDIEQKLELCEPAAQGTICAASDLVYPIPEGDRLISRCIRSLRRYQLKRRCMKFLNQLQIELDHLDVKANFRTL
jgi:hypothetical protein